MYGSSFWVWVLEDYQDRIWVKRHLVHLDFDRERYPFMRDCFSGRERNIDITLVDIRGNEMLFDWGARGVFRYNLREKTIRQINGQGMKEQPALTPPGKRNLLIIPYTKTLVSLNGFF